MKLSLPATLALTLAAAASACTFSFETQDSNECRFMWDLRDNVDPRSDRLLSTMQVGCKDDCVSTRIGAHGYKLCVNGDAGSGLKDGVTANVQRTDGDGKVNIAPDGQKDSSGNIYWRNDVDCPDVNEGG